MGQTITALPAGDSGGGASAPGFRAFSACTKSRFDPALKQLPVTLNLARDPAAGSGKDRWLTFREAYPGIPAT